MFRYNCFGACFLYRRCVQDEIGLYNTDFFGVEDYEYWLRIMTHFGDILSVDQTLYQYRRHSVSLSETRRKMVRQQLNRMRLQFIDLILDKLRDKPNELCGLYIEMKHTIALPSELIKKFEQIIPEIRGIECYRDEPAIIFGAGTLGIQTEKVLKEKVHFFVDNDKEKWGHLLANKGILSLDEMLRRRKSDQIIIAVGTDRVYEMMVQLWRLGIHKFSVAQEILWLYEK